MTTLQSTIEPLFFNHLITTLGQPLYYRPEFTNFTFFSSTILPIVSFIQMTDLHIIDPTSPTRVYFLRNLFPSAYRKNELLSTHVVEAMIQKINSLKESPVLGIPYHSIICTGDNTDNQQCNELQNYINLFDGKMVKPIEPNVDPNVLKLFYNKQFPNMVSCACKPFKATGSNLPWYGCYGNHDTLCMGNVSTMDPKFLKFLNKFSTGSCFIPNLSKDKIAKLLDLFKNGNVSEMEKYIKDKDCTYVPSSEDRRHFTKSDFINAHLSSSSLPCGHGFKDSSFYKFLLADNVLGVVLDSCNEYGNLDNPELAPNGSIDVEQMRWLKEVLKENMDKFIIIFSHHDSVSMNNVYGLDRVDGKELLDLFFKHLNVILWVNGHNHCHNVRAHFNKYYKGYGFWEINTASHIDFPQQARSIEIGLCGDAVIIYGVCVDHVGVVEVKDKKEYNVKELAGLGRRIAWEEGKRRKEKREDENVRLVLKNPFK